MPVDVVVTLGRDPAGVRAGLRRPRLRLPAIVSFHAVFIHANVRWHSLPRWVVTTPEYHHWHHSSDEEGIDKNFSASPAWDVLFGTAHQPDYWPKRFRNRQFSAARDLPGTALLSLSAGAVGDAMLKRRRAAVAAVRREIRISGNVRGTRG
jgi:hypothetical protein